MVVKQAKPVYRSLARRLASVADPEQGQLDLCLQIALQHAAPLLKPSGGLDWLKRTAGSAWKPSLEKCLQRWHRDGRTCDPPQHREIASLPGEPAEIVTTCLEQLLAAQPGSDRRSRGVYYTPQPLAEFVIRGARNALATPMQITGGLAGLLKETPCTLLDPAAGAGVFLAAAIHVTHCDFLSDCNEPQRTAAAWNAFVDATLLPALCGVELMLPACALAHVRIALALHATGYCFAGETAPDLQNRNALQPEPPGNRLPLIVGNPPYAALTTQVGGWINKLMKGKVAGAGGDASYFHVDGQPLGERKLWLHDQYVQFLRYAQYCVDRAGGGVTAFVTNRGFLDNITFRGVRNALMQTYNSAHIVDLFPGGKNGRSPAAEVDENLFEIDQGVAAAILAAPPGGHGFTLHYRRLTGARQKKLQQIAECDPQDLTVEQTVSPPHYFLTPQSSGGSFYQQGWPLDEIMPVHAPTIVTARDKLVIGFTRQEVASRIARFCDLTVPDEQIRQQFFPRSRSQRYPPGDTRGWKLSAARRALAAVEHHAVNIRPCTYRAADKRYIYWSPAMIDWPRTAVSRLMLREANTAFVTRRQSPPDSPCDFFWATDNLVLDGVLRSDNRGGETFFPWQRLRNPQNEAQDAALEFNLQAAFQSAVQTVLGDDVQPEEILQMLHAQFHIPAYRTRFAPGLRTGYPRVFIPRTRELFDKLVTEGRTLIAAMQMKGSLPDDDHPETAATGSQATGITLPAREYPRWENGRIYAAAGLCVAVAGRTAWEFRAGAHQICRKWLRDRRGMQWSPAMLRQYQQVVQVAAEITAAMQRLERAVDAAGGFEAAFASRDGASK